MKLKKVINLYGGPGVGKSTIAAGLFYKMKMAKLNVELVTEYAKSLTYEDRFNVLTQDQIYIFAKQHRRILRLVDEVDYIVTDSPLLMTVMYARMQHDSYYDQETFERLTLGVNNRYPNEYIHVLREPLWEYDFSGRSQTLKEAEQIDDDLTALIQETGFSRTFVVGAPDAVDSILRDLFPAPCPA